MLQTTNCGNMLPGNSDPDFAEASEGKTSFCLEPLFILPDDQSNDEKRNTTGSLDYFSLFYVHFVEMNFVTTRVQEELDLRHFGYGSQTSNVFDANIFLSCRGDGAVYWFAFCYGLVVVIFGDKVRNVLNFSLAKLSNGSNEAWNSLLTGHGRSTRFTKQTKECFFFI